MRNLIFIALLAAGCGPTTSSTGATTPAGGGKSLYDRLGGKAAITAVVDSFVAKLAADERVNARFTNTDIPKFKALLVDQVCEAAGGPCKYAGKDMKTAHTGMNITDAEFDALGEDMGKTLNEMKVAKEDQDALLGVLVPMKPQIVGQ